MKKIKCPECDKEEIIYSIFKKMYVCPNCFNVITKEEFNRCYEFFKKHDKIKKYVEEKKQYKEAKAKEEGSLVIPLTCINSKMCVDPIEILKNIKSLLLSDKLNEKEKEDIKILAESFINEMNCTICTHRCTQNYGFGGVHVECDIENDIIDNILDYCMDLPIFLDNCPVKKYKL